MQTSFVIKRIITGFIFTMALLLLFAACKNKTEQIQEQPEYPEEPKTELIMSTIHTKWVDLGMSFQSVRFQDAGEGLYLLEVTIGDNSTKYGFMDHAGDIKIPIIYDNANVFTDGLS